MTGKPSDEATAEIAAISTVEAAPASEAAGFVTKGQGVFETLRHWILIGRLEPGQRLDQEWLAATLNVSRMPLRQALSRLGAAGLVINRPHRGAIVAPLSVVLLEDIYAGRVALESTLAEVGARRIGAEGRLQMSRIIEQQEDAVEHADTELYVQLDRQFHNILYSASNYEQSALLIERLRDMSDRYIRFYARSGHSAHKSILDHWKILRAIEREQPEQARFYTEQHINDGYQVLRGLVQEHEARNSLTDAK